MGRNQGEEGVAGAVRTQRDGQGELEATQLAPKIRDLAVKDLPNDRHDWAAGSGRERERLKRRHPARRSRKRARVRELADNRLGPEFRVQSHARGERQDSGPSRV